jgi:hypothetical protein
MSSSYLKFYKKKHFCSGLFNNILFSLLIFSALTCIFLIFLIAWVRVPFQDDFWFSHELSNTGYIEWAVNRYLTFDGRHLTFVGAIQALSIKYLNHSFGLYLYISIFLFSIYFFISRYFEKQRVLNVIILTIFVFISLIFSFKSHVVQTVFWKVGGIYVVSLSFFILWATFLINDRLKSNTTIVFFYFLSFTVGASTQNLAIPMLFIILFIFFKNYCETKSISKKLVISSLLVIAGLAFISFAPGNRGLNNDLTNVNFNLLRLFDVFIFYMSISKHILFSLVILPFVALITIGLSQKINGIIIIMFFGAAIASCIPFALVDGFLSNRTAIYFQFFLIIGGISLLNNIIIRFYNPKYNNAIIAVNLFIFGLAIPFILIKNILIGYDIKQRYYERMAVISASTEKFVEVEQIEIKIMNTTFLVYFSDINEDVSSFPNLYKAQYFGLDSIKALPVLKTNEIKSEE